MAFELSTTGNLYETTTLQDDESTQQIERLLSQALEGTVDLITIR